MNIKRRRQTWGSDLHALAKTQTAKAASGVGLVMSVTPLAEGDVQVFLMNPDTCAVEWNCTFSDFRTALKALDKVDFARCAWGDWPGVAVDDAVALFVVLSAAMERMDAATAATNTLLGLDGGVNNEC